jgi:hypothetical protein
MALGSTVMRTGALSCAKAFPVMPRVPAESAHAAAMVRRSVQLRDVIVISMLHF